MTIAPRQVFESYERGGAALATAVFCEACGGQMGDPAGSPRHCLTCGRAKHQNALPAVSVLVARGDEVLLCKRRARAFRGARWCLPCGYVDFGEDFLTAAKREVREETGIVVGVVGILSVVSNFFRPDLHSLVVVLLAEPNAAASEPVGGDDADEAAWFNAREALPELAFEADEHIIRRYFDAPFLGAPVDDRYRSNDPPWPSHTPSRPAGSGSGEPSCI